MNNPINASDPSGHKCDGEVEECQIYTGPVSGSGGGPSDSGGGGGGDYCDTHPWACGGGPSDDGGSCDTDNNGHSDIACPGQENEREFWDGFDRSNGSDDTCPVWASLVECYYGQASLKMGQDPMNINSQDFYELMLAIYYDVHGRNGVDLYLSSVNFDTPFYDWGRDKGPLPGIGCIDGLGCYARHELNYVAQGELAAAGGLSREAGFLKVIAWKFTFGGPFVKPSPGTVEMYNLGYNFYHTQNGSTPPQSSFYISPGIAPSILLSH